MTNTTKQEFFKQTSKQFYDGTGWKFIEEVTEIGLLYFPENDRKFIEFLWQAFHAGMNYQKALDKEEQKVDRWGNQKALRWIITGFFALSVIMFLVGSLINFLFPLR